MVVYLKLTTKVWVSRDYTDQSGNAITGTLYSNTAFTSTVNWSTYTSYEVIFLDSEGKTAATDTANLTLNSNGTFTYKPPQGKFYGPDLVEMRITVKSSTERLSTISVADSALLRIEGD